MPRVLHLLSQRPSLTGSGITLDALIHHAAACGWTQAAAVGVPLSDAPPQVDDLSPDLVRPLFFESPALPFAVPGMSDVMPYRSSRFSSLDAPDLVAYRRAWREHITALVAEFCPHIIHSHHIWIMSSLLAEAAPGIPVLNHCHATGLRQMELCPHLADDVRQGCRRNEAFAVLHNDQRAQLARILEVAEGHIHVVGAGYREELFHCHGRLPSAAPRLVYVGKLSAAKGLPQLLDAFTRLRGRFPTLELHLAGSGSGEEAAVLGDRMADMAGVKQHGQLGQPSLAELMRSCLVCVLPSFYEGLPLVLVEALACGCRLVATALPGLSEELAPQLETALELVPMPAMASIDQPQPTSLPTFIDNLSTAIATSLQKPPIMDAHAEYGHVLANFGWASVFHRVETIWRRLISKNPG